jgi:hypothetical protein
MKFIFSKLPNDIIQNIITFDKHFILRNGKVVSIIPKDDYRYNVLSFIIPELNNIRYMSENRISYTYYLPNCYDIPFRKYQYIENDMLQVRIQNKKDYILYEMFICRLKPKLNITTKPQLYYKGNLTDYEWYNMLFKHMRI